MTAKRWKITLEYDGSAFAGWQRQSHMSSVQQSLEDAIRKFSGEAVLVHCAGRTDAGVHALAQVAHFDLERPSDADTVRKAINAHLIDAGLKGKLSVLLAEAVGEEFHARHSACRRHYLYRILCRRPCPVMLYGRVWHFKRTLDVQAMQQGARHLLGHHDFTTFRDSQCQASSPVKTLDVLTVREVEDPLHPGQHIEITASSRSFLHHQVRNMVGTLVLVGEGKWHPDDVKIALEARDRTRGGPTAPPEGLYFVRVDYDDVRTPAAHAGTGGQKDARD